MKKKTLAKLGGFAVAVACTGALIGVASGATGAYFTDSHSGNADVSTGSVKVNTTDISALSFNGLLPGNYKTATFQYNAQGGSDLEDIYLEFPGPGDEAIQAKSNPGPIPLGRYGHLTVSGPDGSFNSFNLAADNSTTPDPANSCTVDQYGRGGADQTEATDTSDIHNKWCPAPKFILLSYGLDPQAAGNQTASITFGFTGLLQSPQGTTFNPLPFKVVATQHGVLPGNVNNAPFSG